MGKRRKKLEKHNEQVEKELEKHCEEVQTRLNDIGLAPKDFPKEDHDKWEEIYRKKKY